MRRHVQQLHDATEYGVLHGDSHRRYGGHDAHIIQPGNKLFSEEDLHKVHHVSPCPDAYVLDEESNTCKPTPMYL
jgi:hypothetical protein